MIEMFRRYREAIARRQEDKDQGFSLIELIVVVAILGILIAIAIPVFSGIQKTAQVNSLKSVAANGANVVAAQIAAGKEGSTANLTSLQNSDITEVKLVSGTTLDSICVSATGYNQTMYGGNGAKADGTACNVATP
jgi:type IV pilus assembly protein PilA